MILTFAWRNIWRNKTRSLVVVTALALGIWAALAMTGMATGMMRSYVRSAIGIQTAHLQIHHPVFREQMESRYLLPEPDQLQTTLLSMDGVSGVALRSIAQGMVASSRGTRGVLIKGVDPGQELTVSTIGSKVISGAFEELENSNGILISVQLAEKLKVGLRKKVVLTVQDLSSTITSGAFRVVGLFHSGNTPFDEAHVFVHRRDLNRMLAAGQSGSIPGHEIAVLLDRPERAFPMADSLRQIWPTLDVNTYRQLSPDLQLYESQIGSISLIYLSVIMLALVFGIINTMLMAVLERTREIGMLMAIGMNRVLIFRMIVLETLMLSVIGAPFGLLLGAITLGWIGKKGIDLSSFSESLAEFGLDAMLYLEVDPQVWIQVPAAVLLTGMVAALYPAWKAVRLKPVESMKRL